MFVNTLRESARPGRSSHVSGGTRTPPADARSSHRDDDDVTSATPPSDKLLASGPRDARRGRLGSLISCRNCRTCVYAAQLTRVANYWSLFDRRAPFFAHAAGC